MEQIALNLVLSPSFAAVVTQTTGGFTTGATSFYEPGQSSPFSVAGLGFLTPPLLTKGTFF